MWYLTHRQASRCVGYSELLQFQPGLLASALPSPPPAPPASPPVCPPEEKTLVKYRQRRRRTRWDKVHLLLLLQVNLEINFELNLVNGNLVTDLELGSWQKVDFSWWQQHSQLSWLQSVWKTFSFYRHYHYSHESRGGAWQKSFMHTKQILRTFHLTLALFLSLSKIFMKFNSSHFSLFPERFE